MPPRETPLRVTDYLTAPTRSYTTGDTWTTSLNEITAGQYTNTTHTTTNNPYDDWITINNPYKDWVSNSLNINANASYIDAEILGKKVRIAIDKVLDQYFRKLYEIINDVHNFSISEDEFMKLLKED